jgi:TonB-linked SusC/RagA family outer membrane protein
MENGSLRTTVGTPFHHPTKKMQGEGSGPKHFVMPKLIILLIVSGLLQVSVPLYGQGITLSLKNVGLEKLFTQIEQQSTYHFVYTKEEIQSAKPVSITVSNAALVSVLQHCMKGQPLEYSIKEPYVIIKRKETAPATTNHPLSISGRIVNEEGEPVIGATISLKGTKIATATNENGEWKLEHDGTNANLFITSVGYSSKEVSIAKGYALVVLQRVVNSLDETVVIAYGKTTRRLSTGNVVRVTAEEISKQPISNPLAALQGRVPGLEITQNSGVPGAGFTLQLRGINSLTQGTEPLILIDGLPFGNGNRQINQISNSAIGGVSPFNTINISDIESIEVLKDADATAIYGSRGANGVILITTKKGQTGKTSINARLRTGFSKATRTMDLMNTSQYLAMRREAFQNDGVTPTMANAPDLFGWDTTKYTDFKKMFAGGTARTNDVQVSVTGGNSQTRFLITGGYSDETGFLSNSHSLNKKSIHFSLNHKTDNNKIGIDLSASYVLTKSDLLNKDLASLINTAPHFPLYDSLGNLNWLAGNTPISNYNLTNPLAILRREYEGQFNNLNANLLVYYNVLPDLRIKLSSGMQLSNQDEITKMPKTSLDPTSSQLATAGFANGTLRSWQLEPQVEWTRKFANNRIQLLGGLTFQETINKTGYITGANYSSDLLLNSPASAGYLVIQNDFSQYRYSAAFARATYDYKKTFLMNLTARRDASSRFGPQNRFSNFGAIGLGWIFSEHNGIKRALPFLSFGKLRGSWGVTGNDQIGNYMFLDTWNNSGSNPTYQGAAVLSPVRLFNPDYGWERNAKWEAAIDLGFLKDRLLLEVSYYLNRCGSQLVNYNLPNQTGFSNVLQNFDALFRNSGLELILTSKNVEKRDFHWSSSLNVSIPRNKLLEFPGLENTSYRNTFVLRRPISERRYYEYNGIDPVSGIYQFTDVDSNGLMNNNDKISRINPAVNYYGGLTNKLILKKFQVDIGFEFRKQVGKNYLGTQGSSIPGYNYYNQPLLVLNRWQKPGDNPLVQRYAALSTSPAFQPAQSWLANSEGIFGDASYIRLKTLAVQYSITLKKEKILYLVAQCQNLLTITNYVGADPENQSLYVMPPLRTITFGAQIIL